MDANLFWFTDAQWAKIVPHLPTGQPGAERKEDRRILSGIMHVLKVGCRWCDFDWTSQMAGFWQSRFDRLEDLLKRMDR
jgi:transposase